MILAREQDHLHRLALQRQGREQLLGFARRDVGVRQPVQEQQRRRDPIRREER